MDPPGASSSVHVGPRTVSARCVDGTFRAHPGYQFLSRQQALDRGWACPEHLPSGETAYGCVYACQPEKSDHQALSPDAALLFLTLRGAQKLPDYFRSRLGPKAALFLAHLVLDGVLEIEHQGVYLCGHAARAALFGDGGSAPTGLIAERSSEALHYADSLVDLAVPELTRRLYNFGRLPITPARRAAYPRAAGDPLGGPFDVARVVLAQYWMQSPVTDASWIMWRPLRITDDQDRVRFKLYISPGLDDIGAALAAAAQVLGQSPGVRGLKAGRGLAGHTRCDKLVAYFSRLDDLQASGLRLHQHLQGCSVHGVPFSADLSGDGLLSWAVDPPRDLDAPAGSWRFWLTRRLATHFVAERAGRRAVRVRQRVLDRLRLDGVDPHTWMPDPDLWSAHAGMAP